MRVAMLTGGGDCPGLNAVMRAVARKAERTFGDDLVGAFDLASLQDRGWLDADPGRVRLTDEGMAHSDAIGPWLVSDPVRSRMAEYELR